MTIYIWVFHVLATWQHSCKIVPELLEFRGRVCKYVFRCMVVSWQKCCCFFFFFLLIMPWYFLLFWRSNIGMVNQLLTSARPTTRTVCQQLYMFSCCCSYCCCWPSHYPFGQYYPVITQPLALVWCTYLLLGNRFCWPSPVTSACSKFIYVIQAVRSAMFVCAPHYCEEINCSLLHKWAECSHYFIRPERQREREIDRDKRPEMVFKFSPLIKLLHMFLTQAFQVHLRNVITKERCSLCQDQLRIRASPACAK